MADAAERSTAPAAAPSTGPEEAEDETTMAAVSPAAVFADSGDVIAAGDAEHTSTSAGADAAAGPADTPTTGTGEGSPSPAKPADPPSPPATSSTAGAVGASSTEAPTAAPVAAAAGAPVAADGDSAPAPAVAGAGAGAGVGAGAGASGTGLPAALGEEEVEFVRGGSRRRLGRSAFSSERNMRTSLHIRSPESPEDDSGRRWSDEGSLEHHLWKLRQQERAKLNSAALENGLDSSLHIKQPVHKHVRRKSQVELEAELVTKLKQEQEALRKRRADRIARGLDPDTAEDNALATTTSGRTRAETDLEVPMRYNYTIILRNPDVPTHLVGTLRELQEQVVTSLLRMNLEVKILSKTDVTERKLVLLVTAESEDDELLHREAYRLDCERYMKFGTGVVPEAEFDTKKLKKLTPAMKVYLTWLMVERALEMVKHKDFEIREQALSEAVMLSHIDSVPEWKLRLGLETCGVKAFEAIAHRFPLHDLAFNERFMSTIIRQPWGKMLDLSGKVDELYQQFGARVALYFAFVNAYTRALFPLAIFAIVYYLAFRLASWSWYVRGLAIVGLAVPAIWAPITLKIWQRKNDLLAFDWELQALPDKAVPNPHGTLEFEDKFDEKDNFGWREYDPKHKRTRIAYCMIPFAIINLLFLCVAMTPFVQWYVFGKLSPTCDCCEYFVARHEFFEQRASVNATYDPVPADCEVYNRPADGVGYKEISVCTYFVTCFSSVGGTVGTDRWVYILIQGILLGIALDVVQFELFVSFTIWLTGKESWPSEAEYERNLIRKQFVFLWVNMYFWFLFIAFVYVPFGDRVQDILMEMGLGFSVPGSGWRSGVINLDEAFVTPLVVTQALNLTLETFIPYLAAKAELKASTAKRAAQKKLSLQLIGLRLSKGEEGVDSPGTLSRVGRRATKFGTAIFHGVSRRIRTASFGKKDTGAQAAIEMANKAKAREAVAAEGAAASGAGSGGGEGTDRAAAAPPALGKQPDPSARTRPPKLGAITEDGGDDDSDGREEGSDTDGASPAEVRINMAGSGAAQSADESKAARPSPAKAATGIMTHPKGSPHGVGTGGSPLVGSSRASALARVKSRRKSKRTRDADKALALLGIDSIGHIQAVGSNMRHTPASLKKRVTEMWRETNQTGVVPLTCSATSEDRNHYTATDVLLQAKKEEFHPRGDYLDMLMQFGYVCMFTSAWVLCPVTAFVNNMFEIRGDAFKMLYGLRRPVPSMDRDIGEWMQTLHRSATWAIPVVAGLTVVSTGQVELWSFDKNCDVVHDTQMGPNLGCFTTWGIRLLAAILVEHLALTVQFWVTKQDFSSAELRLKRLKKDAETQAAVQARLLPDLPPEFERHLKAVFDFYDDDKSGTLDRSEAGAMFSALHLMAEEPRVLNEDQLRQLFGLLDEDQSMTISFAECAMAVKMSEGDPLMHELFGMNLHECAEALAQRFERGLGQPTAEEMVAAARARRIQSRRHGSHGGTAPFQASVGDSHGKSE